MWDYKRRNALVKGILEVYKWEIGMLGRKKALLSKMVKIIIRKPVYNLF